VLPRTRLPRTRMKMDWKRIWRKAEEVRILGVKVDSLSVDELDAALERLVRREERSLVLHVNVHCLNLSQRDAWLRDFLNSASVVFCDGAGVMLGARILGKRIRKRIPITEWIWQLAELAEAQGFTLFLLGARPGIAERAAAKIKQRFAFLQIVGMHHGYFDPTPGGFENEKVITMINDARPDVLVVGLGMPLQERWLMENWKRLDVKVALTGGAILDRVAGQLRRGPRWMTDNGLEWLSRLAIEPRRLWKRYLIGNPVFLLRVLRARFTLR
jgi:N-acetylglucosaminyldiphosphoundecaprenol N-acetyl-beta-D-mannosaminyltransferase